MVLRVVTVALAVQLVCRVAQAAVAPFMLKPLVVVLEEVVVLQPVVVAVVAAVLVQLDHPP